MYAHVQAASQIGTAIVNGAGLAVADAVMAAVVTRCGKRSRIARAARLIFSTLAAHGLLDNILRVDSFGTLATRGKGPGWRAVLYGYNITEQQRAFNADTILPDCELIWCDLENKEDIRYVLYERDELYSVYGCEPVTVYGQERERATATSEPGD